MRIYRTGSQILTVVAALFALALLPTVATAQVANPLITVDENGKGTLEFPGIKFALVGVLAPDPGPGGLAAALTYNLLGPPALVAGDVFLIEPNNPNEITDVVRFNPAGTGGNPQYPASLVFYSDNFEPSADLADTGLPLSFYTNSVRIMEVGDEGTNGAIYTPTANEPGFVPGFAVTYHFISDNSVPEPGSIALLCGFGVTGSLIVVRRVIRRKK